MIMEQPAGTKVNKFEENANGRWCHKSSSHAAVGQRNTPGVSKSWQNKGISVASPKNLAATCNWVKYCEPPNHHQPIPAQKGQHANFVKALLLETKLKGVMHAAKV